MKMNLTAVEILEKEFKHIKNNGYDNEEVDNLLDLVIQDYIKFEKLLTKVRELELENQNLKITINALKNNTFSNIDSDNHTKNINIDILKRISRLEQAVFGINKD